MNDWNITPASVLWAGIYVMLLLNWKRGMRCTSPESVVLESSAAEPGKELCFDDSETEQDGRSGRSC